MKKIFLALALCSTTACSTVATLAGPAPLVHTTVDEKGLILALQTFDTTLTVIDRLVAAGVIKPGSPTALTIAKDIETAKLAFQAAIDAQKAGNAANYLAAFRQAQVAIADIDLLVKGEDHG